MLQRKYVSEMANLFQRNKLNAVVISALIAAVLILLFLYLAEARRQTVVIIPKGLSETVTVGRFTADKEYLSLMGSQVAFMFMNFDPTNVHGQYERLAALTAAPVRKRMFEIADEYKKSNVSSRIQIYSVDVTDKDITVSGLRSKYILDKLTEEKAFKLAVRYSINFGSFKVEELSL